MYGGRVLICSCWDRMPRSRIEGLLAGFPKLTDAGTQHTTIETENVRYVYQPLVSHHLYLTSPIL
jgi:hypothetical protein